MDLHKKATQVMETRWEKRKISIERRYDNVDKLEGKYMYGKACRNRF